MVTISPSGDTTGATDAAAINRALAGYQAVQLVPGAYSVNEAIEIPAHGVMRCAARDALGALTAPPSGRGSLPAVIASAGWADNANTDGLNGACLSSFTVDGNNSAANGIVLQTFDGRVDNVGVLNTTRAGILWSNRSENWVQVPPRQQREQPRGHEPRLPGWLHRHVDGHRK